MQLTITADEASLLRLVGTETFLRGRDYARRGAVLNPQFREDRGHAFGQVLGTARMPYTATAVFAKSADGMLASFRGTCTCPVGVNCKHTVALVLALPVGAVGADSGEAAGALPAPWERALIHLVRDDAQEVPEPAVALQFDLIVASTYTQRSGRPVPTRLGLRPVLPGRNGGWVRAGISWSSIGYLSYSRRGIAPEHLRLLSEIMAMDASGPSAYYGSASHPIYLESLASRRIWDLLTEARAHGLPLVHTGKQSLPVEVYSDAADVVVDLSGSETGLVLRSQVIVGHERPAPDAALMLGDPVHGIAWWQSDGEAAPRPNSGLRLARFATPVDPALRHLLDQGTVLVLGGTRLASSACTTRRCMTGCGWPPAMDRSRCPSRSPQSCPWSYNISRAIA